MLVPMNNDWTKKKTTLILVNIPSNMSTEPWNAAISVHCCNIVPRFSAELDSTWLDGRQDRYTTFAQCPESKEVYTISLHLRNFHRNVLALLLIPFKSENLLLRVKFFSFVRVITLTILIFVTFQGKIRLVRSRELKSEGLSANL